MTNTETLQRAIEPSEIFAEEWRKHADEQLDNYLRLYAEYLAQNLPDADTEPATPSRKN